MGQTIHRALIVDDDPEIREATALAMAPKSFTCDTARDGREALSCYQKKQHDLVVTDLRMPNIHGHSLILELLKEQEPPIVVVLTGVAENRLVRDLYNRGVQEVVHKPIDFEVFAARMLSLCGQLNWHSSLNQQQKIVTTGNRTIVEHIESAVEVFGLCVPVEVEHLLQIHDSMLEEPTETIIQFLERLSEKHAVENERRNTPRISVLSHAAAIPLSRDFKIEGEPIQLTFNDLSESGACLLHTRPLPTDFVALRWRSLLDPRQCLQAVMRIERCYPMGPFYEVAGPFVARD